MKAIPTGAWPSPITVEDVLGSTLGFSEVRTDGSAVLWLEVRPAENGRSTIMRWEPGDEEPSELSAGLDVRTRVMEYGGGAWAVEDGIVAACDDGTRQVWLLAQGRWRPLTFADPDLRYGDLRLHRRRGLLLAVCEDHREPGEPVSSIVAIDLPTRDDSELRQPRTLVSGADFYSDPELSADGVLAWCQWQHPDMPWDRTELVTAPLDPRTGAVGQHTVVSEGSSSLQPRWTPAGLMYVSDRSGYWNWHLYDGTTVRAVSRTLYDHADPMWTLGNQTWAAWPAEDPRMVVGLRYRDGQPEIVSVDLDDSFGETLLPVPDLAGVESLSANGHAIWAVLNFTNRPAEVVSVTPGSGRVTTIATAGAAPAPDTVSVAKNISTTGRHGRVQAWFYLPHLPGVKAADGDRPPLVVLSHGGPTAMALPAWSPKVQYWTSRGFAVVDINYGGSTGFGRAYRDRLRGNWGIVDVEDCRVVVEHLVERGLVDPARVSITGGSAGGYTTLQSLVSTDVYTAGVSRYGIGDLAMLATDTHKFESRYLDGLVGPWPQAQQVYAERSPILHVDRLHTPMLILQGTDDKVVPPSQAEMMAAAVKKAGQPVAMVMFEGEGHGFRGLDSRRRALLAEHAFYDELWHLGSPDDLPRLGWL